MTEITPAVEKPSLLIVDDEPGICLAIELLLEDQFHVTTAVTAAKALAAIEATRFDVMLLDMRLPDCCDYSLLDQIAARTPETRVMILSASGDPRMAEQAKYHGAAGFIPKPFSRQDLLTALLGILEER